MQTSQTATVDMADLLNKTYELGDLFNDSKEVLEYIHFKQCIYDNDEVTHLMHKLQGKVTLFEECQRFGHFHPDYHDAKQQVEEVERALEQFEVVKQFKDAEKKVNELLFDIATTLTSSISDTIKIPGYELNSNGKGCSSGGSCGCSGSCG